MTIAQRRAWVIAVAVGVMALTTLAAPGPARAATCNNIPGSTPGTDISVAGQDLRVPGVSNIRLCYATGSVPLIAVRTDGNGSCTFACLSVVVPGGPIDFPEATLYYDLDGSGRSTGFNPGDVGGPDGMCLLSVGAPDAPYPDCEGVAIGPDIGDPLDDVEDQVEQLERDLQPWVDFVEQVPDAACNAIPPQQDGWGEVRFCDDPVTWITMATLDQTCIPSKTCIPEDPVQFVCALLSEHLTCA